MRRWVVLTVVALLAASAAHAETIVGTDGGPAWAVGPVVLYPSFQAAIEYTDNLLSLSNELNPAGTWIKSISPGMLLEWRFSHSLAQIGYDLSTRNYSIDRAKWIDTHAAFAALDLEFSNGTYVRMRDDYRQGILDVQVGDPGAEVPFRNQEYRTNLGVIDVGHQREQQHRIGLTGRILDTTYQPPLLAPYFDESGWWLAPDVEWRTGPRTWIVGSAVGGRVTFDRPASLLFTPDHRTEVEQGVRLGARFELARHATLQFEVGPDRQEYTGTAPSNFRGIVGSFALQNTSVSGPHWSVDLDRDAYPSIFGDNNYFVSNQITVRGESPRGTLLRFGGSTAYYRNDYPTDPEHRLDRSWWTYAWMGVRQGVWVEWRATVRYDVRSSTLPGADYTALTYGVALVVGR